MAGAAASASASIPAPSAPTWVASSLWRPSRATLPPLRPGAVRPLEELPEFRRHLEERLPADRQLGPHLPNDEVDLPQLGVRLGVVVPSVAAAALHPLQRREGDRMGDGEERVEIQSQVPGRVVLPIAVDLDPPAPLPERRNLLQRLLQLALGPDAPHQALHALLEVLVDRG